MRPYEDNIYEELAMSRVTHLGAGTLLVSSALISAAAAEGLSPQGAALIAPVHQVYLTLEGEQAAYPPAKTAAEKLERLYDLDQAGRGVMQHVDLSTLPKAQQKLATEAMGTEINKHDLANQKVLKELIPANGWFKVSVDGERATLAAFLIVQHATNDPQLLRDTLPKMKTAVDAGEASGQWYALLFDRVAVEFDHKPQRYGTQLGCVQGKWQLDKIEDPANVDARRQAVGLKESEADYLKHFPGTC
jgi:hypothetical protein